MKRRTSWTPCLALLACTAAVDEARAQTARLDDVSVHTRALHAVLSQVPSLVTLSANGDGIYAGGAHLLLLRPTGSLVWALSPSCRIERARGLPNDGGVLVIAKNCVMRSPSLGLDASFPADSRSVLLRFTKGGRLAWARSLSTEAAAIISGVSFGPDGAIYVAATSSKSNARTYSNTTRNARHDILLLKLDPAGDVVWSRQIRRPQGGWAIGIATLPDGSSLVAGSDGHVTRVSASGQLVWSREISLERIRGRVLDLAQTEAGAILVGRAITLDAAGVDAFAVAVRASGEISWSVLIDVGPSDLIEKAASGAGGGLLLAGSTQRLGATLEARAFRREGLLLEVSGDGKTTKAVVVAGEREAYLNDVTSTGSRVVTVGRLRPMSDTAAGSILYDPMRSSPPECAVSAPVTSRTKAVSLIATDALIELRGGRAKTVPVPVAYTPAEVIIEPKCAVTTSR